MFLFDWLPDFVFQGLLVLGILAAIVTTFFGRLIPAAYEIIVKICMVASLAVGLMWVGLNYAEEKHEAQMAEARLEIAKLEADASNITTNTVIEYVDRVKIIREKGETIEKEIFVYVPAASDAKCVVDSGFLRGHNAAASGVPQATGKPDGSAQGTK